MRKKDVIEGQRTPARTKHPHVQQVMPNMPFFCWPVGERLSIYQYTYIHMAYECAKSVILGMGSPVFKEPTA